MKLPPFERILSLNKYMEALGHDDLKMKTIKMPNELTKFKVEDVRAGYYDIYSK